MSKIWCTSRLLNTYNDSLKDLFIESCGESTYNKLFDDWENSPFDDSEIENIDYFFDDVIIDSDDLFDNWLEDDGIYYSTKKGLSNEKLDIHFIFYRESGHVEFYDDFKEMEREFWDE